MLTDNYSIFLREIRTYSLYNAFELRDFGDILIFKGVKLDNFKLE